MNIETINSNVIQLTQDDEVVYSSERVAGWVWWLFATVSAVLAAILIGLPLYFGTLA